MNKTSAFSIPCPDGDDTGALAIYLETLALTIDTQLQQQYVDLGEFFTPPTAVFTTATTAVINPGSDVFTGAISFVVGMVFNKVPVGAVYSKLSVPGWYLVGANIRTIANATITDNSAVHFHLDIKSTDIVPGATTRLARFTNTLYESNTGGEPQTVTGVFYLPPNATATAEGYVFHNNAGTRTLQSGSKTWYTWIGSGDVTEKVEF